MRKPFLSMTTMILALLAATGVAGGLSGCAAGKASIPTADALGAAGGLREGRIRPPCGGDGPSW